MQASVKWGLLTALMVVGFSLIAFLAGLHNQYWTIGQYSSIPTIMLVAFGVYKGLKETRDEEHAGILTLKTGMKAGLVMAAIGAAMMGIFMWIYLKHINPDFMRIKAGDATWDTDMDSTSLFLMMNVLSPFIGYMVIAFIFSLILKRNKDAMTISA